MSATAARDPERERRAGFVMTLRARGFRDTRVLAALETTPRPAFAPADCAEVAYAERHLPLPCGQTMERPSTVARVLEALAVEPHHRVLEIGTGSGWTAAVLAKLSAAVVTVERYRTLSNRAAGLFARHGLADVTVRLGDGLKALDSERFDRIVLWGAVAQWPKPVLDMLGEGGVAVAPVGAAPQLVRRVHARPAGLETAHGDWPCAPLEPGVARAS